MLKRIIHTPKTGADQQEIAIFLTDGQVLRNRVQYSKGHPLHDPLTLEAVQEKYRICAGRALSPQKVEASMEAILHLEQVDDMRRLIDLLVE